MGTEIIFHPVSLGLLLLLIVWVTHRLYRVIEQSKRDEEEQRLEDARKGETTPPFNRPR